MPRSVRGRLTLAATAVLGVALVLAAVVVLLLVRTSLVEALDEAAGQRAAEVAALAGAGSLPDPLPITGAAVVQVLDAEQRVLASSPGGDRFAALLDADGVARARDGDPVVLDGARLGSADRYRVLGLPLGAGTGSADGGTVLVATSLADVDRSAGVLRGVALAGVPVLVGAVALLAWRVSGSALAPVEALRRGAEALATAPTTGGPRRGGRDTAPGGAGDPPDRGGGRAARTLPVPDSGDEVARLAETLNDVLGRLHDAGDRQRLFVGDAAHELRSPLGSLRTQLEVALAHPGEQRWESVARDCLADVERMGVLVEDLLVLARLDEPGGRREQLDLAALGREVVADLAPGARVPVVCEPALAGEALASSGSTTLAPLVVADPRAVRRAVENLVANAVRHAASQVVVRVRTDGGVVVGTGAGGLVAVLEVADDGPGIDRADRERVFERFTRLDDARDRDSGGAGLGLSIVRAAVERDGGTVAAVEPPGGRGALLRVRLPLATPQP